MFFLLMECSHVIKIIDNYFFGRHHRGEKNSYYCVMTNILNPVLEKIGFWAGLEHLILWMTGVQRRQDGV
jgi:hypothetical protein